MVALVSGASANQGDTGTVVAIPLHRLSQDPSFDVELEAARETWADLQARGLAPSETAADFPSITFPLRATAAAARDNGAWVTAGHVDHDSRYPGFLSDYMGGTRTYDVDSGYNHQGTDTAAWPFGWIKAFHEQVEVVAAAAGTITRRVDGSYSWECSVGFDEVRRANLVIVTHDDNSYAIYGHLKAGTVTPKSVGERVEQGEFLGAVGSSGHSGYPHLHFEVYDRAQSLNDPFSGPENRMNDSSWWERQPKYNDSELLAVMTHSEDPVFGQYKNTERTHVSRRFAPGDEVVVAGYIRDLLRGQRIQYEMIRPNGKRFARGRYRSTVEHVAIAAYGDRITLPVDAPAGTWTLRMKFRRTTLEQTFEVGDFEPLSAIDVVAPGTIPAGSTRNLKIRGHGFTREIVADVQSPGAIERHIEIVRARIHGRKIVLTVRVDADAAPGARDIVLTWPDYRQVVATGAFRVTE